MPSDDAAAKAKKRKKQLHRMGKILGKIWDLDPAFQDADDDDNNNNRKHDRGTAINLTVVGQRIDQGMYRAGRHGWEDFARDVGCVYNRHTGSSVLATAAQTHGRTAQELLGAVDASLQKLATDAVPNATAVIATAAKRKASDAASMTSPHKKSKSTTSTTTSNNNNKYSSGATTSRNSSGDLSAREERAMEQLDTFLKDNGADAQAMSGFRSRVTRKGASNKYDVNFFNAAGRRFRSMVEVGRFLGLVADKPKVVRRRQGGKPSSREQEAEKKRIRKDLERLRKAHQRAIKLLDDSTTAHTDEASNPMEDAQQLKQVESMVSGTSTDETGRQPRLAAARVPDMTGFPGLPDYCTPDVLMTWDFLCTFERALGLAPIALDDFASALVYTPPAGQIGDDVVVPPVYLSEAHLGLLKLLFADKSSDEWWWSTLETDETEGIKVFEMEEGDEKEESDRPVIKINIAAMLAEVEDPLITNSWLSSLDPICTGKVGKAGLKTSLRTALKLVSNKYVAAYIRKSLDICKISGVDLAKKSVVWLVKRFREARPDLGERAARQDAVNKARAKVVDEVGKEMEKLAETAPAVNDEDAVSEFEFDEDSDEESDDEDEELDGTLNTNRDTRDESEQPASALPPKPLPSFVDLLLPPSKPLPNSDFVDAFTWSHLVGATTARILHRKKRLLNEIDDSVRDAKAVSRLVVSERRDREKLAASRFLTECIEDTSYPSLIDKASAALCSGGNYLDLTAVERLSIIRVLIEAAYDTIRVHEVVSGNYKQRTGAMKALEVEQRRANREAKEKVAEDAAAARERLANEARDNFLEEKRDEIRQLNAKSKEFSDDVIESLTDEDIIDFDDDIRADYEALPATGSFSKIEVNRMVIRLQEEAAFDTDAVRTLSMDDLVQKEKCELEELEGQYVGFGGEEALNDTSLDRETIRSIERLRRDVEKSRQQMNSLPTIREEALAQLKDAMEDGTIKVLRTAYNAAKKAKLIGNDDETGGIWAINLMRDAAVELEKAKQNKRVLDAQKDLVAKRNKCFIRTEPVGRDRRGNRFWMFGKKDTAADETNHIWAEAELVVPLKTSGGLAPSPGFVNLERKPSEIAFGAVDMEDDLLPKADLDDKQSFRLFSRREYHSSGFTATLANQHWGCHATEEKLRAVIKTLEPKFPKEKALKTRLKETLEDTVGSHDKSDVRETDEGDEHETDLGRIRFDGDEAVFIEAKDSVKDSDVIDSEAFETLYSGIGSSVRVRHVIEYSKDQPIARYANGKIDAWKMSMEKMDQSGSDPVDVENEANIEASVVEAPLWRVVTERGKVTWLSSRDLMESLSRFRKFTQGQGYFENDSALFSYRNHVGRHCGRATEAPYSSSPYYFAKLMIRREAEMYQKLKIRAYDNTWGGQSGVRAQWTNSMKDYAYDFQTVKQGLITLENAFYELTLGFSEYDVVEDAKDAEPLLSDPSSLFEIELESMDKNQPGLWNSKTSRAIYLHLVKCSKTTGFLALALDLLCRNTWKYLQKHKLLNIRESSAPDGASLPGRRTRRMNAWQQQQEQEALWTGIS